MSTRVAELYADFEIRGNPDQQMERTRRTAGQLGDAADQSGQRMQRAATQAERAYQRLEQETQKAYRTAQTQGSAAATAAERVRIVEERAAAAVREHGEESEQARQATERLTRARRDAERGAERAQASTDTYTASLRRLEAQQRDVSRAAERAGREMEEAAPDPSRIDGFMDRLGTAGQRLSAFGAEHGGGMGGEFLSSFSERISGLGGKAGPIGAALVGVAGIGLAAGALLASSLQDGMEREAQVDEIQAKLGIGAEAAGRIGRAAGDAYMGNFGESVGENMDAARAAIQSGLLTGEESQPEIEAMIGKLSTVSGIMGEEIPAIAKAAGQAIKTGLVTDGAGAMDLFIVAQQRGLNTSEDFLDTINEYGTQFRKLGLNGADAAGLMSQAMQGGARDADVAADALKEFSIRVVDGSETTATAFEALNMNADDMGARFAAGGDSARTAMDEVLDAIRNIEDPLERGKVAAGLFGTQWEDLGGAFDKFDLSTATRNLGEVAGAADKAADTLSGNGAASFETLRRTAEEATMGVKTALAEAFGPGVTDLTEKILENKDEIVAFFADTLVAALMFAEGLGTAWSGTMRAGALLLDGVAVTFGGVMDWIGTATSAIGTFLSVVPGMGDVGASFLAAGDTIGGLRDKLNNAADTSRSMADTFDETVLPVLQNMREGAESAGEQARLAAQGMDILNGSVVAIPDEASVVINDNSPEAAQRLRDLGFIVEEIPGSKNVRVTADTEDAAARLQEMIRRAQNQEVAVRVVYRDRAGNEVAQGNGGQKVTNPNGGYTVNGAQPGAVTYADGGIQNLPADARIQRKQLIQWAEPETGGEAFIPLAPMKRGRSTSILSEVAGKFGYQLLKMADGGITAQDLVARSQSIEGAEYVFGGWDGTWNTDCTGAASRLANMAVYGDPDTGGRFATGNAREALSARGFAEGFRQGALNIGWYNDPGGPGGGHAASTLPDGTNVEMGGARGDGQFGGGAAGAQDFANIMHYAVQGNPAPSELDSPSAPAVGGQSSDSSGASYATTDSTSEDSTDGQRVFVTNWPDGSSAEPSDGPKPRAIATATFFANGGVENHTAQIAGAGAIRVWAEPETGGEAYIPLGLAKRARSRAIWRETGRHLGIQQFAEGGFGGYSGPDTTDYMKPRNLYEAASLATGLGFTAASVFGNYLDMASSGTVDLSKLTPQFDTSSNSIPGADKAFQQLVAPLEEILATLKKGGLVKVDADVNTSTGAVGIKFDAAGIA
ncbi:MULTISPECIES: phage tail tape measure protein [unclassified Rhodococcus (in: high G+C Gram-positive bacteria)]|uniref:phage tail tape measure protein n=1 Tax=unclassified Rhodococcus (in: high G+C Gram-positive bacteria) TaxID=192944 RepID=UPI0006FBDC98|nr:MULTISPECIES: phage tail tape measure protein [unclassified Rhodococcus (in: high G+C Gram-positive bacteria)]KQU30346.1 hypothetical protein ASG69_04630 [Rhodococcus sp. Leaf225]KQU44749.1 hypothetical protein ASH03_12510 [Rhodococcus sp. Leaf258]